MALFLIVAGINGSGKSSAARHFPGLLQTTVISPDFIVPDLMVRYAVTREEANYGAVLAVEGIVADRIGNRKSVAVETVLSTDKYLKHVVAAKSNGMQTAVLWIGVSSQDLAFSRVCSRHSNGGHFVSMEQIERRWPRTHDNLIVFARAVDVVWVVSNERVGAGLQPIAKIENGKLVTYPGRGLLPEVDQRLKQL